MPRGALSVRVMRSRGSDGKIQEVPQPLKSPQLDSLLFQRLILNAFKTESLYFLPLMRMLIYYL